MTVLICLEEPLSGGRTVFPDDGIAVAPKKGCAFVYRSCGELVHFAEAVGTKWMWTSPAALFLVSARGELVEHTAAGEVIADAQVRFFFLLFFELEPHCLHV